MVLLLLLVISVHALPDPQTTDDSSDAGITMPIASGADSSVNLYDQTCYHYPCLNAGLTAEEAAGNSDFDPLGLDTSLGSVANYPTMGSHVFLTTRNGQVVTVDGMPLGANEIGKDPRYSIVEDADGSILSVCDSEKQMCFIPSRIQVKAPENVPIVLRTYEDVIAEAEEEKKKKAEAAKKESTEANEDGEIDIKEKEDGGKKVDKDLSEGDPQTREPGDWDECRNAGLKGENAPTNKRSCINAYNNGMKSTGRKEFIPVDCSQGFIGPTQPNTMAKCPGKFDHDLSDGMRVLEEELNEADEGPSTDSDGVEENSPDDPGDSPQEQPNPHLDEERAVPFEMINEMDDDDLEGPGDQVLPDIPEETEEEVEEGPLVEVSDEPVLNEEDELADPVMAANTDQPGFFDSDIVDEDGDLREMPPEEPLDEVEEDALQDLLGEEGESLDDQAQDEERDENRRAPRDSEMNIEDEPGPDTIEEPASIESGESPDVFDLQENLEDAKLNLLTRDAETGVVKFVDNEEGQEVIGSIIKEKSSSSVPGGSKSISPEELKTEFNLTDEQYERELELCRKATNNFADETFEDCLKENLERFADFLIRVEE
jgi:hypothetical protein